MQVVFRFDSSTDVGMGHLMRCLTLAEALSCRGAKLFFLCSPETSKALKARLPTARCHIIPANLSAWQDAAHCVAVLAELPRKPDWLIVDHYGLGKTWETRLRPVVRRIMAIDDIGRSHDCDLLLDANFSLAGKRRYWGKVRPRCRLLLGPRYALLRRSIQVTHAASQAKKTLRIFLCFGGSDAHDMTRWTAEILAVFLPSNIAVDIVVGYGYAGRKKLAMLCKKHPNWRLFIDHPRPEQLMAQATLAIGAGGTMTWERCALGLPSIVISIADNQRATCKALAARRLICYIGHYDAVNEADLRDAVLALLADEKLRKAMSTAARRLVNVKGVELVAEKLFSLSKP